jgi:Flp pilus assembly protein TadD
MSRALWIAALLLPSAACLASGAADNVNACAGTSSGGEQRIAACTDVIVSGGNLKWAFVSRGNAYFELGRIGDAIADYTEAIRIDPSYGSAVNNRAHAYLTSGDLESALADASRAIQIEPKNPSFFDTRGAIYLKMSALERAIADFDEVIRLDPRYPAAFVQRGLSYEAKNDIARARADYQTALSLPAKYKSAAWARDTAREHLAALAAALEAAAALDRPRAAPANPGGEKPAAAPAPTTTPPTLEAQIPPAPAAAATAAAPVPTAPAAPPATATVSPVPVLTPASPTPTRAVAAPPSSSPAPANPTGPAPGKRLALVIGNSNYASLPFLPTPQNDAADMAMVLNGLGFEVLLGIDLKRLAMEDMLARFARLAREAETALVYYAGHAIQYGGENYLAAIDAGFEDETDLRRLIRLRDIIGDLRAASRGRILIVDACREDEVVERAIAKLPGARAAPFGPGLASISGAEGTLIAFAAEANHTAADGKTRNSPFTQALLKQLATPSTELRTVMTRVRSDVVTATDGTQRPELFDSLPGELVLKAAE